MDFMRAFVFLPLFFFNCSEVVKERFLFEQKSLKDIDTIEMSLGSKSLGVKKSLVSDDFYPGAVKYELEFPLTYERPGDGFDPAEIVSYYFTAKDSTVRLIVYDWDKGKKTNTYAGIQDVLRNEAGRLEEYNRKFDELYLEINELLGGPSEGDGLPSEKYGKQSKYIERRAKWGKGDFSIELNMIFSTETKGVGTYRIRSKVYWD